MIFDRLDNLVRYAALHPGFAAAAAVVARGELGDLAPGKHALDGDRLAVVIVKEPGRGHPVLEAHRRYIDIQITLAGEDVIGWRPLCDCQQVTSPYDAEKDIAFFGDAPETSFAVGEGRFAIFFPDDAHAPLSGHGSPHKAVFKVAVEWR